VFFGSWESYFLLAEASLRGWSVGISDQQAYETGVRHSFSYFNADQFVDAYLASEDYNRNGTSARYSHTAEPPASIQMTHKEGANGAVSQFTYTYPVNHLYQGGAVK